MFRSTLPWRGPGAAFVALALALALVLAASPALADHGSRGHRHHRDHRHRHHRQHAVYVAPAPRVAFHHVRTYPAWCAAPARVVYYDSSPFFLHAGFGVFFGGSAFDIDVTDLPPAGYSYADPYCGRTFRSVDAYRVHLHRHRHPSLIQVVALNEGAGCTPYTWYGDW